MTELRFTIPVPPRSKKNSLRILVNPRTRRPFVTQSDAYKAFSRAALMTIPAEARMDIAKPVNVQAVFFTETRRRVDIANLLSAIHDVLVEAHVLADDNRDVVAGVDGSRVYCDKEHPRVEITISPIGGGYDRWKE